MRNRLIPALAGFAITIAALATAAPAFAVTNACTSGDSGFCGGQVTSQAQPLELAVGVPAAQAKAGTGIVADTPGLNLREDWDMRNPADQPGSQVKIFKFAPRGIRTNLCVTEVGGTQSQLVLERCTGANNQRWTPNEQASGFNWVNQATGLALTAVSDSSGTPVQARSLGAGTGANKRWTFVGTAP